MLLIDYQTLPQPTLQNLLQDCVTRDGTDYGLVETTVARKCAQLSQQLENKQAFIVFDDASECCDIISAQRLEELKENLADGNYSHR